MQYWWCVLWLIWLRSAWKWNPHDFLCCALYIHRHIHTIVIQSRDNTVYWRERNQIYYFPIYGMSNNFHWLSNYWMLCQNDIVAPIIIHSIRTENDICGKTDSDLPSYSLAPKHLSRYFELNLLRTYVHRIRNRMWHRRFGDQFLHIVYTNVSKRNFFFFLTKRCSARKRWIANSIGAAAPYEQDMTDAVRKISGEMKCLR